MCNLMACWVGEHYHEAITWSSTLGWCFNIWRACGGPGDFKPSAFKPKLLAVEESTLSY